MKRIIIFMGLKIAEIGGAFGIFVLFSSIVRIFDPYVNFWVAGLAGITVAVGGLTVIVIVITGLYQLIKINWEWAGKK